MAVTSKFVQLSDYILLEYRYTDLTSPEFMDHSFRKIINGYTSSNQIMNVDNAVDNTNNVRERSVVQIDNFRYVDLDKDQVPPYDEYDSSLAVTTVTGVHTPYDEIRYHLLAGYNFDGIDGVILTVKAKERSTKSLTLSNVAFLKDSEFFVYNPRPIFLGDRIYDRYVSVKIPALKLINDVFYSFEGSPSQTSTLVAKITSNGLGFIGSNPIYIGVREIKGTKDLLVSGADYKIYNTEKEVSVSINQTDEYSLLSAVVKKSTAGDYFEYFASYDGEFIEDFIINANSSGGNNYIILNEIRVFEQVGSLFKQTSNLSSIQETDFDKPNLFRPVILNADKAFSFTIEYTMRLYNKLDSSQIIRVASIADYNPKDWGRHLSKIHLLNEGEAMKIYNKIVDGPSIAGSAFSNQPQVVPFNTKYVPSFFDKNLISLHNDNIFVDKDGLLKSSKSTTTQTIYGQGDLNIIISPFDNFFKFTVLKTEGEIHPIPIDLGASIDYYMVFINNNNKKLRIKNTIDPLLGDISQGDLVFKITESESEKILTFSSKQFYIVSKTQDGLETSLYQGTVNKPDEIRAVKAIQEAIQTSQVAKTVETIKQIEVKADKIAKTAKSDKANAGSIGIKPVLPATLEIPGLANDVPTLKTSIISTVVPKSFINK